MLIVLVPCFILLAILFVYKLKRRIFSSKMKKKSISLCNRMDMRDYEVKDYQDEHSGNTPIELKKNAS